MAFESHFVEGCGFPFEKVVVKYDQNIKLNLTLKLTLTINKTFAQAYS